MKILASCLFILLLAGLTSCGSVPLSKGPAENNSTYEVHYLFEHEGIKVFRFQDEGRYVYFTKPSGEITAIRKDSVTTYTRTIAAPTVPGK